MEDRKLYFLQHCRRFMRSGETLSVLKRIYIFKKNHNHLRFLWGKYILNDFSRGFSLDSSTTSMLTSDSI